MLATRQKSTLNRAGKLAWPILGIVWLLTVATGLGMLIDYDARPGALADGSKQWPGDTRLTLAPSGKTLVMFVHPACPCSLASLEELDRLVQRDAMPTKAYVVVVGPPMDDRRMPRNVARAGEIRTAILYFDPDCQESRRFDSHTSGTLFVFDAAGRQQYCGGVTSARGHVGPNTAWDAAAAAIDDRAPAGTMPVFGCPLL